MPRAKPLTADEPNEPLWWLKSIPQSEYRQSRWWRRRRDAYILGIVNSYGYKRCELCDYSNPMETYPVRFHVHHITYEHIGEEPNEDLILLCAPCHNLVHYPDSAAAIFWANYEGNEYRNLAAEAKAITPNVYR